MRNQTWKAYFYPRTKWGDKRALKVWFLIEIIVESKIEIKNWFKLGFLDKIIKQIAFFDFYHFCEICETRVAHLIYFWSHWNTFYWIRSKISWKFSIFKPCSICFEFLVQQMSKKLENSTHCDFDEFFWHKIDSKKSLMLSTQLSRQLHVSTAPIENNGRQFFLVWSLFITKLELILLMN